MVSTGRKTASGTRPCNSSIYGASETVQPFQYRKRYSPVQPQMTAWYVRIALFQYRKRYSPVQQMGMEVTKALLQFQYRKRYSPV